MGKWEIIEKCIEEHKQGYYKPGKAQTGNSCLIRITDLTDEGYINLESSPKIFVEDKDLKKFSILKGDFLFARTGGAGKFGLALKNVNGVFASYLIRFRFKEQFNIFFLRYFFQSEIFQSDLKSRIHGGVNQNVHAEDIKKCLLPLFSVDEQQRIVAKLDGLFAKIDQAISLLEANLQHTKALMGSVLDEEFGKLEASSKIVAISKIADVKGGKRLPKGKKLLEEKTKYPYIRVSDFTDHGTIDLEGLKFISKEIHEQISRYTITSEDLYISIAGTIGKTGIIPEELNGANLTENAAKLVYKDKSTIDNLFVYFYTLSDKFKAYVENSTKQVAQPKLALTRLKEIKIALPSLEKQKEVVQKFKSAQFQINKLQETQTQKLNHLKALKSSLLDQAFKGEL